MAGETTSPNMKLILPGVNVTPGPTWANDLNSSLTLIDQHNHSPGYGVAITPAGLNISTDLPFLSNNATGLRSSRYVSQSAVLTLPVDLLCLYAVSNDLYFNDGLGNNVRITQSGGVAGSPGSISNLTSPASASYVSANSTFVWQSAANTSANMDFASVIFRNLSASSFGLTLNPPASMAANYALTLPTLPIANDTFLTIQTSGNISSSIVVDNLTLGISLSQLLVKSGGITSTQLASNSVIEAKILDGAVTSLKLQSNINIPGANVQAQSKNVVVSNTNAFQCLAVIRGAVNSSGTKIGGEGFNSSRSSAGVYAITFSSVLGDAPVAVSNSPSPDITISVVGLATTGFTISTRSAGALIDVEFYFIAIGVRT